MARWIYVVVTEMFQFSLISLIQYQKKNIKIHLVVFLQGIIGSPKSYEGMDVSKLMLKSMKTKTGKKKAASKLPSKLDVHAVSDALSSCSKPNNSKATSQSIGGKQSSPGNWMEWFINNSGSDGIKENLEGNNKQRSKKPTPAMENFEQSLSSMGITINDILDPGSSSTKIGNKKRKRRVITPVRRKVHHVLQPHEITQEMLSNIARTNKEKEYDKIEGRTCHHCRQKTSDTKTICRSGRCSGMRGFFCGPCLKDHHKEDIVKALLDGKWACPVCRGTCRCSICRKNQKLVDRKETSANENINPSSQLVVKTTPAVEHLVVN